MIENNLEDNTNHDALERLLWSIATPGFGQFLNRKFLKGTLFVALEFVININAHLNRAIMFSFQGRIMDAIQAANFQWLMFYPCVYMFAIWDAYKDARKVIPQFFYLLFVFPAFLGTVGIMYAPNFKVMGHLLGPVWLPMIFAFFGVAGGVFLRKLLR